MTLIHRYIFKQLGLSTVLLTLICIAVIWLSQSLKLIDLCINRGVNIWVFIKMINLLIPDFLNIVLPIATFIATLTVYYRLIQSREIVVLRSAGVSDWGLANPALFWGVLTTLFLYSLSLYILPMTYRHFRDLEDSLKQATATFVLPAKEFTHFNTMTAYIHDQSQGELHGIVIYNDHKEKPMMIIAKKGRIFNEKKRPFLIMNQGTYQEKDLKSGKISVLYFDDFVYDLQADKPHRKNREFKAHERFLMDLLHTKDMTDISQKNKYLLEVHQRLMKPLFSLIFILVALICLLKRSNYRQSLGKNIAIAGIIVIGLQIFLLGFAQMIVKYPSIAGLYDLVVVILVSIGLYILSSYRFKNRERKK